MARLRARQLSIRAQERGSWQKSGQKKSSRISQVEASARSRGRNPSIRSTPCRSRCERVRNFTTCFILLFCKLVIFKCEPRLTFREYISNIDADRQVPVYKYK